nr:MAG TPA_asm: hypothetical protein [Caudoviricetes sp.]
MQNNLNRSFRKRFMLEKSSVILLFLSLFDKENYNREPQQVQTVPHNL